MSKNDPTIVLGYISGVHGIKGWVKVYSHTEPREAILDYSPWLMGEEKQPVLIRAGRKQGKTLVVSLPGVDSPEQAREWVRKEIAIKRDLLPATRPGEYYWSDLEGLDVYTESGMPLGKVHQMMETGANDVMVVRGDKERLIPFVLDEYVKSVDLSAAKITVDWDPEF